MVATTRWARALLSLLGASVLGAAVHAGGGPQPDMAALPPEFEAHSSRSGAYVIEIRLRPHAAPWAARARASLFRSRGAGRELVWERELPHRPRPRFILVGDQGQVLLLDEYLNVRSDLAVMLIDRKNATIAQHGLEAVRAALDVPISALAPRAQHGVWMQTLPRVSAAGDTVEVDAADRLLSIRLSDGAMSAR